MQYAVNILKNAENQLSYVGLTDKSQNICRKNMTNVINLKQDSEKNGVQTYTNIVSARHNSKYFRRLIYKMRKKSGELLDYKRVSNCGKYISEHNKLNDRIYIKQNQDKTYFTGLAYCGSVWFCPVCALKIEEYRANEILTSLQSAENQKLNRYFVTLTIKHSYKDSCEKTTEDIIKALRNMLSNRTYRRFKNNNGIVGIIKSVETVYLTGWHSHFHIILFSKKNIDENEFYELWSKAVLRTAGTKTSLNGYKFKKITDNAEAIAGYTAKWGLSHELSGISKKTEKKQSITPFAMLSEIVNNGVNKSWYSILYREYGKTFFGKNKITWTRGLKQLLKVDEKTDEQIINEKQKGEKTLAEIETKLWQTIIDVEHEEDIFLRPEIINCIEDRGIKGIENLFIKHKLNFKIFYNNNIPVFLHDSETIINDVVLTNNIRKKRFDFLDNFDKRKNVKSLYLKENLKKKENQKIDNDLFLIISKNCPF